MNFQDLICPHCKQQFNQIHPPRLLTMCGHTYCHKCIKTFVTKRKDKGFKIKCPIDKLMMEIQKPNPSMFPKNIALLNLLKKNKIKQKNSEEQNQFMEVQTCKAKLQQKQNNSMNSIIIQNQTVQKDCKVNNYCLEHLKPMSIFCAKQMQKICTDCALFGVHKGHEIKDICELTKQMIFAKDGIIQLINKVSQVRQKLSDKKIENDVIDLLDNKKIILQKQIQDLFKQIRQKIDERQKEILDELQQKTFIIGQRLRDMIKIQSNIQDQYDSWRNKSKQIVVKKENFDDKQLIQEISKYIDSQQYKQITNQGNKLVSEFLTHQRIFIENVEKQLNGLKLDFSISLIQLSLDSEISVQTLNTQKNCFRRSKDYIQIDSAIKPNKDFGIWQRQNSIQNYDDQDEQSLLDFNYNFQTSRNPLCSKTESCNNISYLSSTTAHKDIVLGKVRGSLSKGKKIQLSSVSQTRFSVNKKRAVSINFSGMPGSMSTKSLINQPKSFVQKSSSFKKLSQQQKNFKLIKQIKEGKIQTVDLTGQQLDTYKITPILQAIGESSNVKTVKLMKNKLDDQFIQKLFKYCLNIQRLNIAQNKLTQQSLQKILHILRNKEHKLRYINMGQNRIVQRKNRKILQEFKRHQINLVL